MKRMTRIQANHSREVILKYGVLVFDSATGTVVIGDGATKLSELPSAVVVEIDTVENPDNLLVPEGTVLLDTATNTYYWMDRESLRQVTIEDNEVGIDWVGLDLTTGFYNMDHTSGVYADKPRCKLDGNYVILDFSIKKQRRASWYAFRLPEGMRPSKPISMPAAINGNKGSTRMDILPTGEVYFPYTNNKSMSYISAHLNFWVGD